jgi:glycosyltransferase involved in cell wall biosynthesis
MVGAPRVSVVMPSYNHAPFVGQSIHSVLSQSFDDFELIITDDGSTDGSQDVIGSFTDPRISFEAFPENRGASEALNRCIARAHGEFVAVISSDDYFLPSKLERQVAILGAAPELAAVFGLPEFVDERGAALPPEHNAFAELFSSQRANRFGWLRHFFLYDNALCHPTVMVRRRIYDELGRYDVGLRQLPDLDMWVRVCAHHPIRVVDEPLIAFRVLDGDRNTSAPSVVAQRRHAWEFGRVLRHYRAMDEPTLMRAFGADIPQEVAERGLPMAVQLALMAAARGSQSGHQLYALETLEAAVRRGVPGVGPKDLHSLTGRLDPFRTSDVENMLLGAVEVSLARDRTADAERERDEAHARIAQLERVRDEIASVKEERDDALFRIGQLVHSTESLELQLRDVQEALDTERKVTRDMQKALHSATDQREEEAQARQRADAQASLQAKLRADALGSLAHITEEHKARVHELEKRVYDLQALLSDVHRSNSWRLTLPIRLSGTFVRDAWQRLRRRTDQGTRLHRVFGNGAVTNASEKRNSLIL